MSTYLQELVVFTGQNLVYAEGSEHLSRSNLLDITPKQIERITNSYGLLNETYVLNFKKIAFNLSIQMTLLVLFIDCMLYGSTD